MPTRSAALDLSRLGDYLAFRGLMQLAAWCFHQASQADDGDLSLWDREAECLLRLGEPNRVLHLVEEVERRGGRTAWRAYAAAAAHFDNEELDKALPLAEESVVLSTRDPRPYVLLARVHRGLGDLEAARWAAEQALRIDATWA